MSLVGFRAYNHPQQVTKRGAVRVVDCRGTPPELFNPLHRRFRFTLDVCADAKNHKCERYFDENDNGLRQSWAGERVWCNPPFSALPAWVKKGFIEASRRVVIVMIVPANRTEQPWWQRYVEPYRDAPNTNLRTEFLKGRRRFIHPDADGVARNDRPPFGVCLLIWNGENEHVSQ